MTIQMKASEIFIAYQNSLKQMEKGNQSLDVQIVFHSTEITLANSSAEVEVADNLPACIKKMEEVSK